MYIFYQITQDYHDTTLFVLTIYGLNLTVLPICALGFNRTISPSSSSDLLITVYLLDTLIKCATDD